jgi:hypothetical protein
VVFTNRLLYQLSYVGLDGTDSVYQIAIRFLRNARDGPRSFAGTDSP